MTITLITGANKGIGFETAKQLIELGHTVYIGARDVGRGERAGAALGARFVQLDVTDDASVSSALDAIAAAEGHLDVLVHNAGVFETGLDGSAALRSFDTNAVGIEDGGHDADCSTRKRIRASRSTPSSPAPPPRT